MKTIALLISFLSILSAGCNKSSKTAEIASYKYSSKVELSPELEERVGSWIYEGGYCYGIVLLEEVNHGPVLEAKSVKVKVLVINSDAIKVKANESVSVAPKSFCTKMGIDKGDTWWEKDAHLFETREEADTYIKEGIKLKRRDSPTTFTID